MNKTLTIIAIIVGVIVVGAGTFLAVQYFVGAPQPTPSDVTNNQQNGSNSNNSQTTGKVQLHTSDGATMQANDIKADPSTKSDSYNSGHYFVGYPPPGSASDPNASSTPPYSIQYIDSTQFFSISLLQQPIGAARVQAEKYLMTKLGLTTAQMCRLKYSVAVPAPVDQTYAGTSLGFSFCADAVPLP